MKAPSHEFISSTPPFRWLIEHTSKVEYQVKEISADRTRLKDEILLLSATRKEWEDSVLVCFFLCETICFRLMYLGRLQQKLPRMNSECSCHVRKLRVYVFESSGINRRQS